MYKDKAKQREANKERMRRVRGNTEGNTISGKVTQLEDGEGVTKIGISPEDVRSDAWEKLHSFVQRGNNLEKLQRVCGSLGGYTQGVWMGDLNLEDIGEVIGTQGGLYEKAGR